jgi:hypothetical protein
MQFESRLETEGLGLGVAVDAKDPGGHAVEVVVLQKRPRTKRVSGAHLAGIDLGAFEVVEFVPRTSRQTRSGNS